VCGQRWSESVVVYMIMVVRAWRLLANLSEKSKDAPIEKVRMKKGIERGASLGH
jgi:hypothetical protein